MVVTVFHTMGAGIALEIKRNFPEAYKLDTTPRGDKTKLGKTSSAFCKNNNQGVRVINAYTQYLPGRERELDLYRNIKESFKHISSFYLGKKIGIPKIGCGIAGGDWDKVQSIIEEVMGDADITVVHFV